MSAAVAEGPIVRALPADEFDVHGLNAEMRWEVMRGQGYVVPNASFFVRNHTSTPLIDAETWSLRVFGTGLRGPGTRFSYQDLLDRPARTVMASIECAGNGRRFFASQQGRAVPGTPWRLGAIGVAAWRGVPLSDILDRAGITPEAVEVMPYGLDPDFVSDGVNYGRVRRPIPVAKALDDVILAYEMNGAPLPPDNGYPVRVIVPRWAGIASIKWVGAIEVSATPLSSYWNTRAYRLFGPAYPARGTLVTTQAIRSAFELAWDARLPAHQNVLLTGRSWSLNGSIARTEISTDGGRRWQLAVPRLAVPRLAVPRLAVPRLADPAARAETAWQLWEFPWRTPGPGSYTLRARATDRAGRTQPVSAVFNNLGYQFDGIVGHPVTVA